MVDWELTATTIFCESVDDEVTLIVSGDGKVKCAGMQKYENPGKEVKKSLQKKSKLTGKQLKCNGKDCPALNQYRDKMLGVK